MEIHTETRIRRGPMMSRKGNSWDNAVAESCFGSLTNGRIRKQIYEKREIAIADAADYLGTFFNRLRWNSHLAALSPEQFEEAHAGRLRGLYQFL